VEFIFYASKSHYDYSRRKQHCMSFLLNVKYVSGWLPELETWIQTLPISFLMIPKVLVLVRFMEQLPGCLCKISFHGWLTTCDSLVEKVNELQCFFPSPKVSAISLPSPSRRAWLSQMEQRKRLSLNFSLFCREQGHSATNCSPSTRNQYYNSRLASILIVNYLTPLSNHSPATSTG
jgi:hypothetical protein